MCRIWPKKTYSYQAVFEACIVDFYFKDIKRSRNISLSTSRGTAINSKEIGVAVLKLNIFFNGT